MQSKAVSVRKSTFSVDIDQRSSKECTK